MAAASAALVTPADLDYGAAWAPDGSTIVFTSERNGSADLYQVNADGTSLQRLTDHPAYDDQAAFSPDGRQLVFVSRRPGREIQPIDAERQRSRLYPQRRCQGTRHPLSNGRRGPAGEIRAAAWSPDGTRVAFHKRVTVQRKPWVKTWSRHPQYDLTLVNGGPSFSPAGDRFAFVGQA